MVNCAKIFNFHLNNHNIKELVYYVNYCLLVCDTPIIWFLLDRDSISNREIHRAIDGNIITLNIGLGANVNSFKLDKVPDTERCVLLKRILFRLAEKSTDTQSKLDAANKKIETLEKSKTQDAVRQNIFDTAVVGKKRKNQPVAKAPKQPGMSVINPGSKKRTAAKGVEFN